MTWCFLFFHFLRATSLELLSQLFVKHLLFIRRQMFCFLREYVGPNYILYLPLHYHTINRIKYIERPLPIVVKQLILLILFKNQILFLTNELFFLKAVWLFPLETRTVQWLFLHFFRQTHSSSLYNQAFQPYPLSLFCDILDRRYDFMSFSFEKLLYADFMSFSFEKLLYAEATETWIVIIIRYDVHVFG